MTQSEFRRLNHICKVFATAFETSVTDGCESYSFAKKVMTTKSIDWLYTVDDCQDWCDGWFLYGVLKHELKGFRKGKSEDKYFMNFAGYLYKYWMNTRGTDRKEIYKILPLERLKASFDFYHTQGWEYIIEDAISTYNSKNYKV